MIEMLESESTENISTVLKQLLSSYQKHMRSRNVLMKHDTITGCFVQLLSLIYLIAINISLNSNSNSIQKSIIHNLFNITNRRAWRSTIQLAFSKMFVIQYYYKDPFFIICHYLLQKWKCNPSDCIR